MERYRYVRGYPEMLCLSVFCVGPLFGPPFRWWVPCGALPSMWVPCEVPPFSGWGPLWGPPLRSLTTLHSSRQLCIVARPPSQSSSRRGRVLQELDHDVDRQLIQTESWGRNTGGRTNTSASRYNHILAMLLTSTRCLLARTLPRVNPKHLF